MHGGTPTKESEIIYVVESYDSEYDSYPETKKYFGNKDGDYPAPMVRELEFQGRACARKPKHHSFRVLRFTLDSIVEQKGT